jgi:hypothetical protein
MFIGARVLWYINDGLYTSKDPTPKLWPVEGLGLSYNA